MKISGIFSSQEPGELSKQPYRKYFARVRNLVMLLLMFSMGLKTAEVTGLRWQDLNLLSGKLVLKGEKIGQERTLSLDDDVLNYLTRWRAYQAKGTYYRALEYIFTDLEGRPLSKIYLYSVLAFWFINTFLPVRLIPDVPPDAGF